MDLSGKHALVTGGGRGIGLAVATTLAKAGARVSIIGRDAGRLEAAVKSGAAHAFATADVTDEAATLAVLETLSAAQPFDIVVANAGGAETAPFGRTDAAIFRRMFDLNVIGTASVFRAALPGMVKRKSGRLIAIASTASHQGFAYGTAYGAAKHAVLGLVKCLAIETAKTGVTVNAVSPSYVDTDLVATSIDRIVSKGAMTAEAARSFFENENPMGRLIRPEEVAAMVLYLCAPEAAAITGQSMIINGGEF